MLGYEVSYIEILGKKYKQSELIEALEKLPNFA